MYNETKKIAILIVTYNSIRHIGGCIESIRRLERSPHEELSIFVIDNASQDGTRALVRGHDDIQLIQNVTNEGYAKAMNQGLRIALDQGYDYFLLLNPDITLSRDFLTSLLGVTALPSWGACQGLLLHLDGVTVNSAGNKIHYLGFGYVGDNNVPLSHVRNTWDEEFVPITYASGACVFTNKKTLEKVGLFDERLFSYHEDLDFGWRMWLCNIPVYVATQAHAYHEYEENRYKEKFYLMERNRLLVLIKNYSIRTLLLLSPMLFVTECFVIVASLRGRWFFRKVKGYIGTMRILFRYGTWRSKVQPLRSMSDKELLTRFTYKMNVPIPAFGRLLLKLYYTYMCSTLRG